MIVLTVLGTIGVFIAPIFGVSVYYFFAVLRPQALWEWALPDGVQWSQYVALGTMAGAALHLLGVKRPPDGTRENRRPFGAAHAALLMFGIWLTLSYWRARNQEVAWPWYVEYVKMMTMVLVSALLIQTVRHIWILMILTAVALGYVAYEVNLAYLTTGSLRIVQRGYAGLDNNGAGLMFAMGVPLCVFIYVGTTRWWRWIFAALVPVLLHACLMTFSRGAMVALLIASPLIFFRKRYRAQLGLAAVAVGLVVPILAGNEIRKEFFSVDAYEEDSSAQSRFASWAAAFKIARDYPVVGIGIRNADLVSYEYGADMPGRAIHNQFLQILADSGFPALGFYLAMIASVGLSLRRVRRWAIGQDTEEGRRAYAIACGLESALLVYYVGVLFLSLDGFELPFVLWLLGAQLSLVLGLNSQKSAALVAMRPLPTTPFRPTVPRVVANSGHVAVARASPKKRPV